MPVAPPPRPLLLLAVAALLALVARLAPAQPAAPDDVVASPSAGAVAGASAEGATREGSPDAAADGSGADPEAELAALREAARQAAETSRLVMRTASAGVALAVDSGRVRLAIREARIQLERAVAPARFAVETEEARLVLLRAALGAASAATRTSVEVARLESWTERITQLAETADERRSTRSRLNEERLAVAAGVLERLADPEDTASANTLYTAVVADLEAARRELDDALNGLGVSSGVPGRLRRPVPDDIAGSHTELMAKYQAALALWERLTAEEVGHRKARIDSAAEVVFALNDARLALLPKLSRSSRERVLGLGQEGLAQGRREIGHLQLLSRWYRYDRWDRLDEVTNRAVESLTVASLRFSLMRLILIVVVALVLLRRPHVWLDRLETWVQTRSGGSGAIVHWWQPTRGTLPDAIVLIATLLALRELHILAPIA